MSYFKENTTKPRGALIYKSNKRCITELSSDLLSPLVTLFSLIALLCCRVEMFSEVHNWTEIVSFNGDDMRIWIKKLCSS